VPSLLFIAVAREDGKAWILGESGIGDGEIAEEENRIAGGFDVAGVDTVSAETRGSAELLSALIFLHQRSISQDTVFAPAEDSCIGAGPGCETPQAIIEVESSDCGKVAAIVPAKASSTRGQFHEQRRSSGAN
jgi:hypothetical protein